MFRKRKLTLDDLGPERVAKLQEEVDLEIFEHRSQIVEDLRGAEKALAAEQPKLAKPVAAAKERLRQAEVELQQAQRALGVAGSAAHGREHQLAARVGELRRELELTSPDVLLEALDQIEQALEDGRTLQDPHDNRPELARMEARRVAQTALRALRYQALAPAELRATIDGIRVALDKELAAIDARPRPPQPVVGREVFLRPALRSV